MVNNLKHIYHRWVGLSNSIFIDVSVLLSLRWCLDKIGSLGSFLGLAYLIEVSNFAAILALGILVWIPWKTSNPTSDTMIKYDKH